MRSAEPGTQAMRRTPRFARAAGQEVQAEIALSRTLDLFQAPGARMDHRKTEDRLKELTA